MTKVLESVCDDRVPTAWVSKVFATCPSLKLWLTELPVRMKYVKDCLQSTPTVLALNMFLRPDRLFRVVAQTYAKHHFKDVTNVDLEFQVTYLFY